MATGVDKGTDKILGLVGGSFNFASKPAVRIVSASSFAISSALAATLRPERYDKRILSRVGMLAEVGKR